MLRRCGVALAVLLVVSAVAAPASAAPITLKKSIWGPVERDGISQFPIYADLGVGIYQTTVFWDDVAPTRPGDPGNPSDPAYEWPSTVDKAIAQAAPFGIEVSVMLIGAPPWANGGRDWPWAPSNTQDFATFAAAASRRWPGVRHWMIWSEPTKGSNFQPNPETDRGAQVRRLPGPKIYAQLLDDTYGALKQVARSNIVIGGNTFTTGNIRPLRFARALRLPNGRPPRMDLWGHNPFSARKPDLSAPQLGGGYADFSDLDQLTAVLDEVMRGAKRRRQRHLKLFLSEFSLPTDHENHEFNFHVTREVQARWIAAALRITRRWKRIYTFGYLGLYDDPPKPEGDQVERGLVTYGGVGKPAYLAFRDG